MLFYEILLGPVLSYPVAAGDFALSKFDISYEFICANYAKCEKIRKSAKTVYIYFPLCDN